MTWAAVFPDAALRVMRTAAGRYALRVAVLVGGLFALGLLCGEQAHAVDGVPSAPPKTVRSSTTDALGGVTRSGITDPKPSAVGTNVDVKDPVPGPVVRQVVRSVGTRVVRPVGDVAEKVTEVVADAQAKLPPSVSLPGLPSLPGKPGLPSLPDMPESSLPGFPHAPSWPESPSWPEAPSWPGLPTPPGAPELPGLPGVPAVPGETLPAPVSSVPVTPAPQPGAGATSPGAKGEDSGGRSAVEAPSVHGPRFMDGAVASSGAASAATHRAAPAGPVPAPQSPGSPGGALLGKSAMDSGTSRHGGDANAVTLDHRAPLRLVPGAAVGVDADGTRNRHRDIPVSPA
ncbi:hypothetical protein K4B79_37565 [Streptomyces lincolnensis]|uniref:hypothetical protein n=1 Tax=Streptomyces lincolnensis TaxID=1915 RepID=UPI001E4EDBBA|nr:hypothetical protein [Streptomyces lincolnensis]MCD7443904.1 hypothetical protein [Streptomyces lincolnensis]